MLFRDDFASDLSNWLPFGAPAPRLAQVISEPVLALEGDGRYDDGILGFATVDLRMAATMELNLEFPWPDGTSNASVSV